MALDKTLRALGCIALAVALVSTLGCAANKTKTAKAVVPSGAALPVSRHAP